MARQYDKTWSSHQQDTHCEGLVQSQVDFAGIAHGLGLELGLGLVAGSLAVEEPAVGLSEGLSLVRRLEVHLDLRVPYVLLIPIGDHGEIHRLKAEEMSFGKLDLWFVGTEQQSNCRPLMSPMLCH